MTIPFNKLPWTWDCCCCEEFCNKDELLWGNWTFCSCCWACFEDEFLCGMGSTAGVCCCWTISAAFPVPVPGTGVIVTLPFIFLIRTWGPLLRLLAAAAALLLGVELELAFPFPVRVWLLPPEVEEGAVKVNYFNKAVLLTCNCTNISINSKFLPILYRMTFSLILFKRAIWRKTLKLWVFS